MPGFSQNNRLLLHYFFSFFWKLDLLFVFHLFHMHKLAPSCDHFCLSSKEQKNSVMQTAIGESLESCEINKTSRSKLIRESIQYLYSHSVCFNSIIYTVLLPLLLHIHFTSFKVQAVISISLHCSFRFHYFTEYLTSSSYRKQKNSISGKHNHVFLC